ncbi:YjfB family protein [Herbaspirillum sp. alder98]|uniref:YjfB family protein n=1 Tax=Herbaspirillum sp. alder98 TaxID=2913096 RepID=UPI001CD8761A|nr:YjfB family protein [Herbaspirillum sp. alder98]MCA1326617.1 YjfB family protein [Herbaspirillum sp. alder98]
MDVSQIASLSTSLATAETADAVNITMLKKALDLQSSTMEGLLSALPPTLPANPNIGRNVNTTA